MRQNNYYTYAAAFPQYTPTETAKFKTADLPKSFENNVVGLYSLENVHCSEIGHSMRACGQCKACMLTLYSQPRRRQRVDVYVQLTQLTTSSIPRLRRLYQVCRTWLRLFRSGRVEPFAWITSQKTIPGSLQTPTENVFYSATLLTLLVMIQDCFYQTSLYSHCVFY